MILKKVTTVLGALLSSRRNRVVLGMIAALTALCLCTSFVVLQLNFVTVYEDGKEIASFTTVQNKADEILAGEGITLGSEDELKEQVNGQNIELSIYRAFPVTISVDGQIITLMVTQGKRVSEVLGMAGVSYTEYDKLSAGENAIVTENMKITVARRKTKTVTVTEAIDFKKVTEKTDKLFKGETKLSQKGEKGEKTMTYSVVYEDGKEIGRTLVDTSVTKEAKNEITLIGTKKNEVTFVNKGKSEKVDLTGAKRLTVTATAYCATDDGGAVTALGKVPYYGTVAVDPRVIPLGSKLYIASPDGSVVYGYCFAGDTGGAIKGNRVDLFMNSDAACRAFGRRTMYVYVF